MRIKSNQPACHNDGSWAILFGPTYFATSIHKVVGEYIYLVTEESMVEVAIGEIMAQVAAMENVTRAPSGKV
ncbi:hypothetical protein PanWU01x14_083200 [Parasponia andersonii]|uniref:Uncharacterized protein n=1 Tax=Parasponia andersonii TaxID=3476 RepID=A0A2P5DA18_PARAD|nr:hypothetical protein PanWU01x14_083200 [Parasponia andersonii]